MAAVNTQKMTDITSVPKVMVKASEAHGRKRVWYDTYEAAALASGSTITFARLPKGATIYNVKLMCDALGAGVTLDVGDSGDADRYIAKGATTWNTANQVVDSNAIDGVGYTLTAETDLVITTGGASATGTIKVMVEYSLGD